MFRSGIMKLMFNYTLFPRPELTHMNPLNPPKSGFVNFQSHARLPSFADEYEN